MTSVTLPDGRTLLATGSYDARVQLWDPASRRRFTAAINLPEAVVDLASFGPRLAAATSVSVMTMSLD